MSESEFISKIMEAYYEGGFMDSSDVRNFVTDVAVAVFESQNIDEAKEKFGKIAEYMYTIHVEEE